MPRYRERSRSETYDTAFPTAVIGIAMLSLVLFLAVGKLRDDGTPLQSRVPMPIVIKEAPAN